MMPPRKGSRRAPVPRRSREETAQAVSKVVDDLTSPIPRDPKINKVIDSLIESIRKKHGVESIARFGEYDSVVETFPLSLPHISEMIGLSGWPWTKLVQIQGPDSVGKTSFCRYLIAQAQAAGGIAHFVDAELSPDSEERMHAFGVNTDTLLWSECDTLEAGFGVMDTAIAKMKDTSIPYLLLFDSIAAARLAGDMERSYEDLPGDAARARFLSQNLGKLIAPLKGTKIGIVFVNQLREKTRAMPFEKQTYAPGGRALRHWCHLTIELKKIGTIKPRQDAEPVGIETRLRVEKSKLAPPFKTADVSIFFDGRIEAIGIPATRSRRQPVA